MVHLRIIIGLVQSHAACRIIVTAMNRIPVLSQTWRTHICEHLFLLGILFVGPQASARVWTRYALPANEALTHYLVPLFMHFGDYVICVRLGQHKLLLVEPGLAWDIHGGNWHLPGCHCRTKLVICWNGLVHGNSHFMWIPSSCSWLVISHTYTHIYIYITLLTNILGSIQYNPLLSSTNRYRPQGSCWAKRQELWSALVA